jgi:hypothetical protein
MISYARKHSLYFMYLVVRPVCLSVSRFRVQPVYLKPVKRNQNYSAAMLTMIRQCADRMFGNTKNIVTLSSEISYPLFFF